MNKLPRNVLIIFQERPPIADYLEKSFNDLGIEVIKFYSNDNTWFDRYVINRLNKQLHNLRILPKTKNLFQNHPLAHRNYLSAKLRRVYEETQPDLVLAIRGMDIGQDVLAQISCPKIGWWVEPETHIHEAVAEAHLFDWYFCMNETCVDSMRQSGYKSTSYLPHAVSTTAFYPAPDVVKRYDLCFVGKHSDKRQKAIEAALKVTDNIAIYGPRWREKNITNPKIAALCKGTYIAGADLNQLYNQSKVVLNVTGWDGANGSQPSGLNMRILEVPATQSCLLTDSIRELNQVFVEDQDVLVFADEAGLIQKLTWALNHPLQRKQIAEAGYRVVNASYSYELTVAKILDVYEKVRNA